MAYQLLEKGHFGASVSTDPSLTVTKDAFFINKAARQAFDIDDHEYVELFGDREAKTIGIKLLKKPTLNARKMRGGDGSLTVSVQSVIKILAIKPGRYPLTRDDEGMLEFAYEEVSGSADEEQDADQEEENSDEGRERPARRGRRRGA